MKLAAVGAITLLALAGSPSLARAQAKPAPAKKAAPAPPKKPDPKPAPPKPAPAKNEDKIDDDDKLDDDAPPAKSEPAPKPAESAGPRVDVHLAPPPAQAFTYHSPILYPTIQWLALQLVPNAEIAIGRQRTIDLDGTTQSHADVTWGLRWEVTPLLWSWGLHRKQQRWRTMVVDPLARVSGALEVTTAFEYIGGDISALLVRPGLRGYFPLLHRGEYLAGSIGTSIYRFDNDLRVAYDVGVHFLAGIFGINVTVAPTHTPLTSIITFRLKYF